MTNARRAENAQGRLYARFLRAAVTLVDAGKPVTYGNLASELGRAKQVVWRFVQRHPDIWTYINARIEEANANFAGLVLRRHAFIGMQGSVPSAELYLKAQSGHFARQANGDAMPIAANFQMNFLIPRPEPVALPTAAAVPAARRASSVPAAAALIPRPGAIPTVSVRP